MSSKILLLIYCCVVVAMVFGGVHACNSDVNNQQINVVDLDNVDQLMLVLFDVLDTTDDVSQLNIQIDALNKAKQVLSLHIESKKYVDNKLLMYHMWVVAELAKKQNVYNIVGDN